ncbi:hypothetical protein [uncultured Sphingomonas sp.]|uniref:hypothetical protein n=1 Tax=uncultured Sphingomonas sp. TaxID=158754 RepID=UPI0025FD9688|nr:hypothetical protein [uncultured Sphingomonas sp.]
MIRKLATIGTVAMLSACSQGEATSDCASRFADLGKRFPTATTSLIGNFIFALGEDKKEVLKTISNVTVATGDGGAALGGFGKRDFDVSGNAIMADGKTLVGVRRSASSVDDAVRQGCSLEDRYGTLRTIRLTNAAFSSDPKNEQ